MTRILLVVAFIVVPLVELAIIVQVGQTIGTAWTILALLAVSLAGAWLVRREGTRAWRRFRDALAAGRVPADEVLEGALVLFGGALLLTPGFATDAVGLALMIPPIRTATASTLRRRLGARFVVGTVGGAGVVSQRRDEVVDVEVVNVERTPPPTDGPARGADIHNRDGGSA